MAEIHPPPRTAATTTAAKVLRRCSEGAQKVWKRSSEGVQKVLRRFRRSDVPAQQVMIEMEEFDLDVIPVGSLSCGDHSSEGAIDYSPTLTAATATAAKIGAPAQQVMMEMEQTHVEVIPVWSDHSTTYVLCHYVNTPQTVPIPVQKMRSSGSPYTMDTAPSIWQKRLTGVCVYGDADLTGVIQDDQIGGVDELVSTWCGCVFGGADRLCGCFFGGADLSRVIQDDQIGVVDELVSTSCGLSLITDTAPSGLPITHHTNILNLVGKRVSMSGNKSPHNHTKILLVNWYKCQATGTLSNPSTSPKSLLVLGYKCLATGSLVLGYKCLATNSEVLCSKVLKLYVEIEIESGQCLKMLRTSFFICLPRVLRYGITERPPFLPKGIKVLNAGRR